MSNRLLPNAKRVLQSRVAVQTTGAGRSCLQHPKGSNYPSITQDRHQFERLCNHRRLGKMGCPADRNHLNKASQVAMSELYVLQVTTALLCLQVCYRSYSAYRHLMRMTLRASTPYIVTSCSSLDHRLTVAIWFTVRLYLRASAQRVSCLPCSHKKCMSGPS